MFVTIKDLTLYCGVCDGGMIQHYEGNSLEYFIRCFNKECEEFNRSYKLPTIPVERFVVEAEEEKDNGESSSEGQTGEASEGEVSL